MSKKYYVLISLVIVFLALVIFILLNNQILGKNVTFRWAIYSVYPDINPIYKEGMKKFIEDVKMMTDEQITIEYIPSGEGNNSDPMKVFNAVSNGTVEMGFGTSPYWATNKIPGSDFMYAIPFGLNSSDMYTWLTAKGGLELWKKIYEPFNVIPFPVGDTGGAMGGWFKKEIKDIEDFKGMKIRQHSFSEKIYKKLNAKIKLIPSKDSLGAYNRNEIDAIICLGPYTDMKYLLHKGPQYYYYPGWQEPCGVLSLIINKEKWDQLPESFKEIIEIACDNTYHFILNRFNTSNSAALLELKKQGVKFIKFPPAILNKFREYTNEVLEEEARKNTQFADIYRSFEDFKKSRHDSAWDKIVEEALYSETTVLKFKEELSDYIDKAKVDQKGNNAVVISFKDAFSPASARLSEAVSSKIAKIAKIIDYYSISIRSIMVVVYIDISNRNMKSFLFKGKQEDVSCLYYADTDLKPFWERLKNRSKTVIKLLTVEKINPSLIRSIYDFDKSSNLEIVIEF